MFTQYKKKTISLLNSAKFSYFIVVKIKLTLNVQIDILNDFWLSIDRP